MTTDLFATESAELPSSPDQPLADRMRPASAAEFVGQPHLLGEGKPLRLALTSGRLHSMILWGPARHRKDDAGTPACKVVRESLCFPVRRDGWR